MSKLMKYRVVREHGEFVEGSIREAEPGDVAHLVPKSLELLGPVRTKSDPAPKNKAESAAPANKATTGRKATT